jgi:hypothetical protein
MGDERGQILATIARAVADYGYVGLTLEQVLRGPGMSAERFEIHFESLERGLLVEEPQTLPELEPQFAEFLLLPYLGRAEASRFARA